MAIEASYGGGGNGARKRQWRGGNNINSIGVASMAKAA